MQLRYCAKVGIAAGLGYQVTQGGLNQYAIYCAFTAALVVGTSVGEDLATSANRVKGTIAGVVAAVVTSALFGPNAITIGLAAALTTALALARGWGIQVARIGVTVGLITLVAHDDNAVQYDLLRMLATLIGVAIGLAVSFFIWPAHGPAQVQQAMRDVLKTSAQLLDAVEKHGEPRLRPRQAGLHDAVAALVKAWRDSIASGRWRRGSRWKRRRSKRRCAWDIDVLSCGTAGARTPGSGSSNLRERIIAMSSRRQLGPRSRLSCLSFL